jgi:hypothetical protein
MMLTPGWTDREKRRLLKGRHTPATEGFQVLSLPEIEETRTRVPSGDGGLIPTSEGKLPSEKEE